MADNSINTSKNEDEYQLKEYIEFSQSVDEGIISKKRHRRIILY